MNYSHFKNLWPWLVEAKYLWLALSVNAFALIISLRPGTSEPAIRLAGLVLQVLGIATVAWGISETRALFGRPPLVQKAKDWLGRFPLRRRDVVVGLTGVSASTSLGNVRGFGTHGPGPIPTVESRLDALEKNVTSMHERISATQKELDEGIQKSAAALKTEEAVRQQEDAAIRQKLEATGTGGVHISAIGASWLFVGVILSTAAPELATLLQ